ncbi:hypothetical protein FHS28_000919 [Roseateles terrae]|uniref:Uncharacterized protein n=1 Tax=Roseateles terrae TaxID=431060 RepID=A0ABR6GNA9_9BURK|nr:hypothetical protein [Roseateles terrae]
MPGSCEKRASLTPKPTRDDGHTRQGVPFAY